MLPPELPTVALIELLVELPDQPPGKTQLQPTPDTLVTEQVCAVPEQTVVVPEIAEDWDGVVQDKLPVKDIELNPPVPVEEEAFQA